MDPDRIKGAAKEIGGKIEELAGETFDHEETRAEGVSRQIAGKTQNLCSQAKDNLRDAGDRAERAMRETGDLAEKVADESFHRAAQVADALERSMGVNPARNLSLALAAGFLAGILFRKL